MAALREELAQLRREVEELKAGLQTLQAGGDPMQIDALCRRHLKEVLARAEASAGVGIYREVVVTDGRSGTGSSHEITTYTRASDLPRGGKLRDGVAAFMHEPVVQAVRALAEPLFEGKPMSRSKADLAALLGRSEPEVEELLRPLVADGMLRWSHEPDGAEICELSRSDIHPLLVLSLVD